jgi:hypothetical protein
MYIVCRSSSNVSAYSEVAISNLIIGTVSAYGQMDPESQSYSIDSECENLIPRIPKVVWNSCFELGICFSVGTVL